MNIENIMQSAQIAESPWARAFTDPDIVGPMYSPRDERWYIDPRSRTTLNAAKTFAVGTPYMPVTGLYPVPPSVLGAFSAVVPETDADNSTAQLREVTSAEDLDYTKLIEPISCQGIIPAIAVDEDVLMREGIWSAIRMVGFATKEAVAMTLEKQLATFYSRSRRELWTKGETSGNTLKLRRVLTDCDQDTVIYDVSAIGPSCHTGAESCFMEIDEVNR